MLSWVRFSTSNLLIILLMLLRTVASPKNNCSAISLLDMPWATRRAISRSLGVRLARAGFSVCVSFFRAFASITPAPAIISRMAELVIFSAFLRVFQHTVCLSNSFKLFLRTFVIRVIIRMVFHA